MDAKSPQFLSACAAQGVDPRLAAAIITVESHWEPWACRYEPAFDYLTDLSKHAKASRFSLDTEITLQKQSYGLMQLMGGTARELGFEGPLPRLFDPGENVRWGLKLLRKKQERYPKGHDAIAAYNAGSARRLPTGKYVNQGYVDKVLKAFGEALPTAG